ncbi:type II toxin-antitoxin system Phd/YefM family antitoxin [Candidatus Binatia bacterium]|nr:type II toxin-antitoxin system Phd/YefM family antitoxin [Candidatus Binatia bacterium]
MTKVNVHEAKTHLSEYLDRLERGEEEVVTICRRNEPIAELRALPRPRKAPRPILRRDPRFRLAKSFFEPLPDEILGEPDASIGAHLRSSADPVCR